MEEKIFGIPLLLVLLVAVILAPILYVLIFITDVKIERLQSVVSHSVVTPTPSASVEATPSLTPTPTPLKTSVKKPSAL